MIPKTFSLIIFFIYNIFIVDLVGIQNSKNVTAEQLIENLKNQTYTGEKTDSIRLNQAPIRNLFVEKKFGIEPLFARYSGLKWIVDDKCNIKVSIKCDGIPWDQMLGNLIRENNLDIVLKNEVLLIQFNKNTKKNKLRKKEMIKKIKNRVLPEINRPEYMKIYKNNIYVSDSGKIMVYSLNDFKYKYKIGKFGQGPGEFNPYPFVENMGKISLQIMKNKVFIGSRNKVSYFDGVGKLNKEIKITESMAYHLQPFGQGYVGIEVKRFPKWLYVFNLYNDRGDLIKKICSYKKNVHTAGVKKNGLGMVFLSRLLKGPEYLIYGDRLFISGADGFNLDIYNRDGDRIDILKYKYNRKNISSRERKKIINVYRSSGGESFWNMAKNIIKIPDYYPEFRTFKIAQNIIYFQTYEQKKNKTKFVLFSLDGQYIKTIYLPLTYKNFIEPYTFAIHQKKIYQFVENEDGNWKIHKEKIQ